MTIQSNKIYDGIRRLGILNRYYGLQSKDDYFTLLKDAGIEDDAPKYMLLAVLIENVYTEYKQVLIEYLQLPGNLTDRELLTYIQLLGD